MKENKNTSSIIPELVSGLPYRSTTAFTLIELLVVVLIIGILAAIGVTQYQKAVTKSRAMRLLSMLTPIVQAADLYYLREGRYPTLFSQLDVSIPGTTLMTGKKNVTCGPDLEPKSVLKGDDFEITLNNGGVGKKYRIFAYFTTGKYKCRGFIHILDHNDARWNAIVNHKTFCGEEIYRRACGETNCDPGILCKEVLGKKLKQKNFSTIDLYTM